MPPPEQAGSEGATRTRANPSVQPTVQGGAASSEDSRDVDPASDAPRVVDAAADATVASPSPMAAPRVVDAAADATVASPSPMAAPPAATNLPRGDDSSTRDEAVGRRKKRASDEPIRRAESIGAELIDEDDGSRVIALASVGEAGRASATSSPSPAGAAPAGSGRDRSAPAQAAQPPSPNASAVLENRGGTSPSGPAAATTAGAAPPAASPSTAAGGGAATVAPATPPRLPTPPAFPRRKPSRLKVATGSGISEPNAGRVGRGSRDTAPATAASQPSTGAAAGTMEAAPMPAATPGNIDEPAGGGAGATEGPVAPAAAELASGGADAVTEAAPLQPAATSVPSHAAPDPEVESDPVAGPRSDDHSALSAADTAIDMRPLSEPGASSSADGPSTGNPAVGDDTNPDLALTATGAGADEGPSLASLIARDGGRSLAETASPWSSGVPVGAPTELPLDMTLPVERRTWKPTPPAAPPRPTVADKPKPAGKPQPPAAKAVPPGSAAATAAEPPPAAEVPTTPIAAPTVAHAPAPSIATPAVAHAPAPASAPAPPPIAHPPASAPPPAPPSLAAQAAAVRADAAPPNATGLTPPPEYIAARDAALHAAIAARKSGAAPRAASDAEIAASYEESMAALFDVEEERAPGPQPRPAPRAATHARKLPGGRPARRRPHREHSQMPGRTGEVIAAERNPMRMLLGALTIGFGLLLLTVYLPWHAPRLQAEQPRIVAAGQELPKETWHFRSDLYTRAQVVAGGFGAVGLLFLVSGIWFKPAREVPCNRCGRYVVAQRDGLVLKCPRGRHRAGYSISTLALTIALMLCVALMIHTVAMGSIIRG